MFVIDAHVHIGVERKFGLVDNPEDVISNMKKYNVDVSIAQPQVGSATRVKDHEVIADMAKKYKGKIYGLASFYPFCEEEEYRKNAEWAINDLKFVGLKLHTIGDCASPLNAYSRKVFETARDLKVPVMIHTGNGIALSLPSLAIPMAREFPDLPIILAHSGAGIVSDEAIVAAEVCDNIYLETSWVNVLNLMGMVKKIGAEKIMFGSDVMQNVPVYLAMYNAIGLTDGQLEQCLGKTAKTVFKLK